MQKGADRRDEIIEFRRGAGTVGKINPICEGPGKEHDEYIRDPYDSGYDPRRYGFRIAHVRRCCRNQPFSAFFRTFPSFSVLPFPGHTAPGISLLEPLDAGADHPRSSQGDATPLQG